MQKYYGFIEALEAFQEGHEHKFCMPSHSGRYINQGFFSLVDKYGMHGIDSCRRSLQNVATYEYKDGVLGDLGHLYHQAFNSQLSLLL